MKSQIAFALGSFLVLSLAGPGSFAHQHETCKNLQGNSCWHVVNETSENVQINCGKWHFQTQLIQPGKTYSYQFCSGLSDGLGYGSPGDRYQCEVTFNGKDSTFLEFFNITSGDRVAFTVQENKVQVTISEVWGRRVVRHEALRRR